MLGLFGNTLTAAQMYPRHNSGKFMRDVQTLLSQKLVTLSDNFFASLQST